MNDIHCGCGMLARIKICPERVAQATATCPRCQRAINLPPDAVAVDWHSSERIDDAVLIVDDDKSALHSMELLLLESGLHVIAVTKATDAIRCVCTRDCMPSVAIVDQNLPGPISGFDLATSLKRLHPNLRCLFISTDDRVLENEKYLARPFGNRKFVQKVRELLSR